MRYAPGVGIVVLVAVLVAGCASGPKYSLVASTFPSMPAQRGRIFFYRPSALGPDSSSPRALCMSPSLRPQ